ncbi:UvrD-helicase domain-containing protein [Haloarchaeobius sp. DFWS5]|uniref:UvrD-helicase domain-containing protein n=1 Tax=Haloarchaeobius sp. DFWS5 TaxID=3446114 RepID=UPI003EB96ADA
MTDEATDEFVRLDGAQQEIRDAFFETDSGLFVQLSDPGAGKSTTTEFVAAEYLVRAHRAGIDAPEERLAVVSFTRDDAAAIAPGIADALLTLARDPESGYDLSEATARELGRRVQHASSVGTVDSVLGDIFARIAREVGFDDVPDVGGAADLRSVRAACLADLRGDDQYAARLDRLEAAYPGGEYLADAGDLLTQAYLACRERQLTVAEFRTRLASIVAATYPDGAPESFADIRGAVELFVGADAAERYDAGRTTSDQSAVLAADRDLYETWTAAVDDLCVLLDRYSDLYDDIARRDAVASHLDAAHWVAHFFHTDRYESEFRRRLRDRFSDRLSVAIVDEGQDVSTVQAAALSPLVDEETRVLLVGDLKQLVFLWRNAQPSLFRAAVDDGRYFGIDWETHVVAHEHRTRRCRPDVARAVDSVFVDVFTDPARGADGTVTGPYAPLEPTRADTDEPNVHVAAFSSGARAGSPNYVRPAKGVGEADALASCLDSILSERGQSTDVEDQSVTVLFHRRTRLAEYTAAFEQAGFSVGDATDPLFEQPVVRLAVEVCGLLSRSDIDTALRDLLGAAGTDSTLGDTDVPGLLDLCDYRTRTVVERDLPDKPAVSFVEGLDRLAARRRRLTGGSVTSVVEAVVDELDLRTDPLELGDDPDRRVAALDALLEQVDQHATQSDLAFDELVAVLERLYDDPKDGPTSPLADEDAVDIVFKTIFQMKGAESDVVVLGDIAGHVGQMGPHTDTFCAQGSALALAPPASEAAAATPPVPGFEHGLFDVERDPWDLDAGLRWVSQHWADEARLAGSPPLADLAHAHRGGRWRLLYVAMTRARDHLVVPLPNEREYPEPRDSWVDTLRDGLGFDGTQSGTYEVLAPDSDSFDVQVQQVTDRPDGSAMPASVATPDTGSNREKPAWTPRFVNPSTLYPLLTNPEEHVLDHLQRRPLHTGHDGVADDLSLTFETLGPDDVGDVAHAVLATAIRNHDTVSTQTLRQCDGVLADRLQRALDDCTGVEATERDRLERFVRETVCPQFADSVLWERVTHTTSVFVEEPVDTLVRIDDLDTEMQGHADVVFETVSGDWEVHELKVFLQTPDAETRARYELQAQLYAWCLSQQLEEEATVTAQITQLGVETGTVSVDWSSDKLQTRLKRVPRLINR